jgi:outer membrane protein
MTFNRNRATSRAGTAIAAAALSLLTVFPLRAQEPAQTPPPPQTTLTFDEALRRALQANPTTETARAEVRASEAQLRQIRSAILPKVELNGRATRNSSEVAFEFNGFEATVLPENDWRYDVTLRQPIYAGGRELKALRQGRLNVERIGQGVRQSEEQVLLGAASDYLAVVAADALLGVERGNLEVAGRRRKQSQAFYEAGEVTRVDILRAETDMKSVERAIAAAEQNRETAASRLRLALALDDAPGARLQVAAPKLDFPTLPAAEELIRQAQANRPEIKQAELALEINQLEVSKQRAARLPVVRAEASYISQRANFPADQYGTFSINLNLPIWDSGEITSKVVTAETRRQQAEIALAERKRAVREDVLQALLDLQTAEKSLALAKDQLAAAEAEYNQSFELYRAQEATSLDLQASESSLAEARRVVVASNLDRDLAELSVWSAVGTLKNLIVAEEGPK